MFKKMKRRKERVRKGERKRGRERDGERKEAKTLESLKLITHDKVT